MVGGLLHTSLSSPLPPVCVCEREREGGREGGREVRESELVTGMRDALGGPLALCVCRCVFASVSCVCIH